MRGDDVSIPGLPRLLADLERCKRLGDDTEQADMRASGEIAQSIRGVAPVRTGYLISTVGSSGPEVTIGADYWTFVEAGTVKMSAHPFVASGIGAAMTGVENVYLEHTEDAFAPVIGSHY